MDFFDNALGKAKEAIDIVSKKTEEVVSTQKIRFNIASLENKCSKHYESLGKIYYEKLLAGNIAYDDAADDLVKLISEKENEILKLKEELNNVK